MVVGSTALLLLAGSADAEIVRLTNGRVMTVDMCRIEGEMAVLLMRGGGQITLSRELIAEVRADEVPLARTAASDALAASPTAAAPALSREAIRALVDRVAARVGLDARLAHAVVRVESNYQPLAMSPKGAMGLMQIMPQMAAQYALMDPFNPEGNLEAGMRHLQTLMQRFDDVRRALAAYNAGATAVVRYGGVPPYDETRSYVQRIMTILR